MKSEVVDHILEMLMDDNTPIGQEIEITQAQIEEVCDLFVKIPTQSIVYLENPCYIIGDLHGQFHDALKYIKTFNEQSVFVFLGDYVDRGFQAVETLMLLFCLKIKYPSNYILLRGNHELEEVCSSYSHNNPFVQEIMLRYQNQEVVYDKFIRCFDYLPLACVVQRRILCVHGCIPVLLQKLEQLNQIQLPFNPNTNDDNSNLVISLLWSDPIDDSEIANRNLTIQQITVGDQKLEYIYNTSRNAGEFCAESRICKFLDGNDLDVLIRGHEAPGDGFKLGVSGRVITAFGASNYLKNPSKPSGSIVIQVSSDCTIQIHIFRSDYNEQENQ